MQNPAQDLILSLQTAADTYLSFIGLGMMAAFIASHLVMALIKR
ncbi:hypothetical protein AB6E89_08290 [Vibrio breoganii]|nr:hypothetical protein [Vibrio breoganii]